MLSIKAIKANRCSDEHLVESEEITQELAFPALSEDEQSLWDAEWKPISLGLLLVPSVALMPITPSPAASLQAHFLSQSGIELIQFHLRPPSYGGDKGYPYNAISLIPASGVEQHSPLLLNMGLPPVYNYGWTDHAPQPSLLNCWKWQFVDGLYMQPLLQWFWASVGWTLLVWAWW